MSFGEYVLILDELRKLNIAIVFIAVLFGVHVFAFWVAWVVECVMQKREQRKWVHK